MDTNSDNTLLEWAIFNKRFDANFVLFLVLKIIMSQIGSYFLNNEIEKYLEKEITATAITQEAINRKNVFLKINKKFNKLKHVVSIILLGAVLPINVRKVIRKLLQLLTYLFSKLVKRNKPINKEPLPEIIKIVLEKAKEPIIKVPADVALKIKIELDPIRFERECHLIKEFVMTQKELIAEMEKGKAVKETVGERITRYCTMQITSAIKRAVMKIQNQPIETGLKMVKAQGDKVNESIDLLQKALMSADQKDPKDLKMFINISKDLAFTMKCLTSYNDLFKNGVTPDKLEYLRQNILPDLFVILVAMRKEMKK